MNRAAEQDDEVTKRVRALVQNYELLAKQTNFQGCSADNIALGAKLTRSFEAPADPYRASAFDTKLMYNFHTFPE
ncbi:hypothetical protein OH492_28680 [Vibrio chagasii]|nr:hypothetical protein [Vibrio chagasii]